METNVPTVSWDSGQYSIHKRLGDFVQYFQVNLPTASNGIPLKIINPTALMSHMMNYENTDDVPDIVLNEATEEVDMFEGIPTIEGLPIWDRLDGESIPYYKLFKEYREMLYLEGSRAIAKLARNHDIQGKVLSVLSKIYHWYPRVKAYDIYKDMQLAKKRQFEMQKMTNRHIEAANKLLEQGLLYLEDHPEQLTPKEAIRMVELAIKSGRLSVGLSDRPATGQSSAANIHINTTNHTGAQDAVVANSNTTVQTGEKEIDVSYTQSILHILDSSGALDEAKNKVIEAEFKEVSES